MIKNLRVIVAVVGLALVGGVAVAASDPPPPLGAIGALALAQQSILPKPETTPGNPAPAAGEGCGKVTVTRATAADIPALIADAECFGKAAASASSSQVYRLQRARELAADLLKGVGTGTPVPGGPSTDIPAVKPRPENLSVSAFSPYSGDEVSVIERYRPAFAALGYTIGHHTDYEGCQETEETVCYTWWAAKSADLDNTVQTVDFTAPRLWQYGGNLYGQIESENAAAELLARVKRIERR